MSEPPWDVIVLGAGAAGLICAREAAQRGRRVLLLEHGQRPGRKLRASGGGRCNFTNRRVGFENYISQNPRFVISALSRFGPEDFLALLERARIPWEEREQGQLFGQRSAADLLQLLVTRALQAGAQLRTRCTVLGVDRNPAGFEVATQRGPLQAAAVVVACGGLAAPQLGASALGHELARGFGLRVVPPRPALVPLTWSRQDRERFGPLAGIAQPVEAWCEGSPSFREALLFTHRGLSGPAVLQVSSYWRPGEALLLDLSPEIDLARTLFHAKRQRPRLTLRSALCQRLPRRLVLALEFDLPARGPLGQLSDAQLRRTASALHVWRVQPAGTEDYGAAEVTAGGVDTQEISQRTMECRAIPGLFFVGEVLDVTGWLGGYNLQWAWSSGWCAGRSC